MKTPVVQQHPQRRAAVSFKVEWGRIQQMWEIVHQQNNNKQNTCSGLKTGHLRLAFWSWACWGFLRRGCSWCYWQHCSVDSPFVHASILLCKCFETVRLRLFFTDDFFYSFYFFFQKKIFPPLLSGYGNSEYCWINLNLQIAISKHSTFSNLHILSFLL